MPKTDVERKRKQRSLDKELGITPLQVPAPKLEVLRGKIRAYAKRVTDKYLKDKSQDKQG